MSRYTPNRKTLIIVLKKTNGNCAYCGCELYERNHLDDGGKVVSTTRLWAVDHIVPLSRGGKNSIDNYFASCALCNKRKGILSVEKFREIAFDFHSADRRFYFEKQGLRL